MESASSSKGLGNTNFANGDYVGAHKHYSDAINILNASNRHNVDEKTLLVTCYSNRAACSLKQVGQSHSSKRGGGTQKTTKELLEDCVSDCTMALEIQPGQIKALFRRAQAYASLDNKIEAIKDLKILLHFDPKNAEAIKSLRFMREGVEQDHIGVSDVTKVIRMLRSGNDMNGKPLELGNILNHVKSLIGLCADDAAHTRDFARQGGLQIVETLVFSHSSNSEEDVENIALSSITLLSAVCQHPEFVRDHVTTEITNTEKKLGITVEVDGGKSTKLSFVSLARLVHNWNVKDEIHHRILSLLVNILKLLPHKRTETMTKVEVAATAPRVEELPEGGEGDDLPPTPPSPSDDTTTVTEVPFLKEAAGKEFLDAIAFAMNVGEDGFTSGSVPNAFSPSDLCLHSLDCLSTFLSACADYITPDKEVDYRMESLEERRVRTAKQRIIRRREYNHAIWTLESDALSALVPCLNSKVSSVRVRALPCFGRLVTNACDDKNPDFIDPKVKEGESAPEGDLLIKSYLRDYLFHPVEATDFHAQKIDEIRTYACVASALLACSPDIGIWSLQVANGIRQVMFLISTGDARCQEIASEVICLASASADGGEMLRPLLESGMVTNLIKSSHAGTRAAAAAALTKLSIKAKALEENSPEIAQVLNAAFDVLRVEVKKLEKGAKGTEKSSGGDSSGVVVSSESIASVERSIEVIAAMAGKSYIKEEIVHGSSRVAKATEVLSKVSVDSRSTAAYGLAHIFAALSVTNRELRALALAEKEMTLEQYDKLQELQRIKTKDKDGNDLEEKKEEEDMDTAELCSLRIKRISASGGIGCLVRLMSAGSTKTKETSARALRQICVEQSSRGMFIQEGGLKACCAVATSKDVGSKVGDVASSDDGNGSGGGVASADARREAAHAIAKSLVTTDPRLLSAHQRLGVIQPLLVLCRDVDSTNLQQFEALMALTNILTAGEGEVGRFMKEKGHHAVHYLIFSDHHMVRRAACEVFCNIPLEEEVLKIMRKPEKVRLWLGLCEDWDNADGGEEAYLAARACAGTLASSVMDPEVADAVLVENVGASLNKLLGSEKPELIHRALVVVSQLMGGDESVVEEGLQVKMVTHFLEAGVVLSLTAAVKVCKNVPSLYTMAKDTAEKLVMLASGLDAVGVRT